MPAPASRSLEAQLDDLNRGLRSLQAGNLLSRASLYDADGNVIFVTDLPGMIADLAVAVEENVGPAGRGFTPRGAWTVATAYAVDDIVTANGSTFRVTVAHTATGTAPTAAAPGANLEVWAAGATGDTGWLTLTLNSPIVAGAAGSRYRVRNSICHFQVNGSYTGSYGNNFLLATFPVGARPTVELWPMGMFTGAADGTPFRSNVLADGSLLIQGRSITAGGFTLSGSFPVG